MARWKQGIAAALWLALGGCAHEPATPVFRAGPPDWPTGVSGGASVSVGVLTGEVYKATSVSIDERSGLPAGYALVENGNATVTVRQPGTRKTWQGEIASGSYRLQGLPLGVTLEVTASKFGMQPRTRSVILAPHGQGRLSFAYFGGVDDSYLLPQPSYQAVN